GSAARLLQHRHYQRWPDGVPRRTDSSRRNENPENRFSTTMNMTLTRREVFRLLSAAPALALRGADSGRIIRSHNPEDFEMPLDGFSTWITPAEKFFVRTHLYKPTIDANKWRLKVGGQVANTQTLEMAEL